MTIKGSCLCGGVRFEIDAARSLTFCHCSNCRKLSGAAFASYVHVDADKFRQALNTIDNVPTLSGKATFKNPPDGENLSAAVIVNQTTGRGTFEPLK